MYEIASYVAALGVIIWAAWILAGAYGRRRQVRQQNPITDLGEPLIRIRLQRMIEYYGLTGSVNIREGKVLPAPSAEGKAELARLLMAGFATGLGDKENAALMLCVHRDGQWVPTGVSLDDLRMASICLEE